MCGVSLFVDVCTALRHARKEGRDASLFQAWCLGLLIDNNVGAGEGHVCNIACNLQ